MEAVLADVEAARKRLQAAIVNYPPCPECGEAGDYCCCMHGPGGGGIGIPHEYADLRGESIPELPEAAAREGIPFH